MAAAIFRLCESLRVGSAPLSEQLIEQMRQAFPQRRIVHGYGTTEAGPIVFGPHPDGLGTDAAVGRRRASAVELRPGARWRRGDGRGRARNAVSGA